MTAKDLSPALLAVLTTPHGYHSTRTVRRLQAMGIIGVTVHPSGGKVHVNLGDNLTTKGHALVGAM